MKKAVMALALGCCVGIAQADQGPKWDGLSVSYQSADFFDEKLTGFGISGTKLINEDLFLAGSYSSITGDTTVSTFSGMGISRQSVDLKLDQLSLGFGFRVPINPQTDFYSIVSYETATAEVAESRQSDRASVSGYGLRGGVRSMVSERIELSAGLAHISDGDESDNYFNLGANVFFTDHFALGLGYSSSSDMDVTSVSASIYF